MSPYNAQGSVLFRRPFLRLFPALLAAALLSSCAGTRYPAWPPRPGEPAVRVTVFAERFHSILGLPGQPQGAEEWAFGERVWFYDEKDTDYLKHREYFAFFTDACRALCWPRAGVVEISKAGKPFDLRNPETRTKVWEITVSEEGARRMRAFLEGTIDRRSVILDEGGQTYYASPQRYHVLYTCHHYVARALRAGGVPIHPGWCFFPSGLWMQLDRTGKAVARKKT